LFANKPFLFANRPFLFGDKPLLFANKPSFLYVVVCRFDPHNEHVLL
jgi:hypothetical protein